MSEEIRVKNATTGGEKGQKLERFDLLPAGPLAKIARHYGVGARKYADRNWEKGYDWSLSYGALQRHLNAFWDGEDIDEETGSPHLAAAGFHVLALLEFMNTHPELDNRPSTATARAAAEKGFKDLYMAPPQRYVAGVPQNDSLDESFKDFGWLAPEGFSANPVVVPNVFNQTISFDVSDVSGEAMRIFFGGTAKSTGRVSVRKIAKAIQALRFIDPNDGRRDLVLRFEEVVEILDALEDAGYEVTHQGTPPPPVSIATENEVWRAIQPERFPWYIPGTDTVWERSDEPLVQLSRLDSVQIIKALEANGLKVVKA